MIHLCYVSTAKYLMTQEDLLELLDAARQNNSELGITGMLLYKGMSFLQVLEGETTVVHTLYEKISQDKRYERVKTLFDEPIDKRDFPDWTMGFEILDGKDLSNIVGYTAFMEDGNKALGVFDNATRARKILLYFRAKS